MKFSIVQGTKVKITIGPRTMTNTHSMARGRLHMKFTELGIGDRFQLVNSVMHAAMPNSPILTKRDEATATDAGGRILKIRIDSVVELVIKST